MCGFQWYQVGSTSSNENLTLVQSIFACCTCLNMNEFGILIRTLFKEGTMSNIHLRFVRACWHIGGAAAFVAVMLFVLPTPSAGATTTENGGLSVQTVCFTVHNTGIRCPAPCTGCATPMDSRRTRRQPSSWCMALPPRRRTGTSRRAGRSHAGSPWQASSSFPTIAWGSRRATTTGRKVVTSS